MTDIYDSLLRYSVAIKTILEVYEEPKREHFFEMTDEMINIAIQQGVESNEKLYIWIPNNIKVENQEVMVFTSNEVEEILYGKEIINKLSDMVEGEHKTFINRLKIMEQILPDNFM
ncbi:MAG: hypothetical protein ACRC7N_09960 [Clostridium sp.]